MHCPFYLAIAIFVSEGGVTWTETADINEEEVDINDYKEVLKAFPASQMTSNPSRVMLIANNTSGGPRTIQDWG